MSDPDFEVGLVSAAGVVAQWLGGQVVEPAGEAAALSPHLRLDGRDFVCGASEAARLGVSRVPTLVLGREGEGRAPVRSALKVFVLAA